MSLHIWYKNNIKLRLSVLRFLLNASRDCAWNALKNCVRVLIGRKPYFDERGLFLRQYLLHLSGLRPIRNITCTNHRREGAASQAFMIMKAICFARASGLTYMHTPFTEIHHAERPMQEWVSAWETLFNLGEGEVACNVKKHEVVNYYYGRVGLDLCFGWRKRPGELDRRLKAIIPEFRRKYYLNKSPRTTEEVTVAVNIRRGDVSAENLPYLFTRTEKILHTLNTVKSILDARNISYRVDVYTNGNEAEFSEFRRLGAGMHINPEVDPIWTMQELIEADILIMAKGCFSGYAALMSDGIRIFEPKLTWGALTGNWLNPSTSDNWLPCLADGTFDKTAFEHQLALLIQAKTMAVHP